MGIFTRLRDIISSNINAMLERAEDPQKLIKLMIQEMEDTLVEVKASCAGAMANAKKVERAAERARQHAERWADNARLAVEKERDDLAREALVEKARYRDRADALERELDQLNALVAQYKDDIMQLEEKLAGAREKQRVLVQRHIHARGRKQAEQGIRRLDTSDAFVRFEQFENRIERMEAEADLVNYGRKPALEEEFARLEGDEEIEKELQALKQNARGARPDAQD
jgi:phage shock protein A